MRAVSLKRARANRAKPAIRQAVFERDGYRCLLGGYPWAPPCSGTPLTPHHLKKASQGGPYALENLVTLCGGHQTWVEDEPDKAHALGLVVRRGEEVEESWQLLRANGLST